MKFCCLGSGSEGNSIVVKTESSSKTTVLVDCGIKFDDLENRLLSRGIDLSEIENVRIGKHITLDIEAESLEFAENMVDTACQKMLCNQIMESYTFKLSQY